MHVSIIHLLLLTSTASAAALPRRDAALAGSSASAPAKAKRQWSTDVANFGDILKHPPVDVSGLRGPGKVQPDRETPDDNGNDDQNSKFPGRRAAEIVDKPGVARREPRAADPVETSRG